MRATFVAFLLVVASVAAADTIGKWRTPDGRLYIGDDPPEGSVREGEFRNEPGPELEPPASIPAPKGAAATKKARWKRLSSCNRHVDFGTWESVNYGYGSTRIKGQVEIVGKQSVDSLNVCIRRTKQCDLVRGGSELAPGRLAEFWIPYVPAGAFQLTSTCRVRVD